MMRMIVSMARCLPMLRDFHASAAAGGRTMAPT